MKYIKIRYSNSSSVPGYKYATFFDDIKVGDKVVPSISLNTRVAIVSEVSDVPHAKSCDNNRLIVAIYDTKPRDDFIENQKANSARIKELKVHMDTRRTYLIEQLSANDPKYAMMADELAKLEAH